MSASSTIRSSSGHGWRRLPRTDISTFDNPASGLGRQTVALIARNVGHLDQFRYTPKTGRLLGDRGKWSLWAARRRIRGRFGARLWQTARFRTAKELSALQADAGLTVNSVKGAIFYPPWTVLARFIAPLDRWLGDRTTLGAAIVAVQATKTW
jgi:hypothetical protein